jgi:ABC-type sugar transport system ATPase subunit
MEVFACQKAKVRYNWLEEVLTNHQVCGVASGSIELKNVSVHFGNEVLLHPVSIKIASGEKLVLIGPSGQGKSVLIKLMAGILKPTTGQVFIDNRHKKMSPFH